MIASAQRYVGCQAYSSGKNLNKSCLEVDLDVVTSVLLTVAGDAPSSWRVVDLFSSTLVSGAVASVQLSLLNMRHLHADLIDTPFLVT